MASVVWVNLSSYVISHVGVSQDAVGSSKHRNLNYLSVCHVTFFLLNSVVFTSSLSEDRLSHLNLFSRRFCDLVNDTAASFTPQSEQTAFWAFPSCKEPNEMWGIDAFTCSLGTEMFFTKHPSFLIEAEILHQLHVCQKSRGESYLAQTKEVVRMRFSVMEMQLFPLCRTLVSCVFLDVCISYHKLSYKQARFVL